MLVLAYCGLRWSEVAALRVASFDPARRRLTVSSAAGEVDGAGLTWGSPKSHKARWVPVEDMLAAELATFVDGRGPGELLFTVPDGGVLRNRNARRDWSNGAAAAAGAVGLTPHELRHTAASLASSAGANVKAAADARTRVGGDHAGRVRGPVPGRSRGGRTAALGAPCSRWRCPSVAPTGSGEAEWSG
ncbi:tyrosine-type recombinase/integrase [Jatrophihabitans fulvus]